VSRCRLTRCGIDLFTRLDKEVIIDIGPGADPVNQEGFYTPERCHALTLTERIASPRTIRHRTRKVETNADLAKRRMQRWQAQAPFTTGSYFAQRLA
jgi:hypothetical protein